MTRADDPFRLRRRDILVVVSLGLGQVCTLVAFILLVRAVIDRLVPDVVGPDVAAFNLHTMKEMGALLVVALVHGALRYWEFSASERIGYNMVRDLRMRMYEHLQGMTSAQLQHRARGGLLLRFIGDLSMLRMWVSRGLLGGTVAFLVVLGTSATLTVLDLWLGLSVMGVLSAGAAVSLTRGKAMRRATRTMRRRRSLVIGNIDEQINALEVVQVFGRANGERARLAKQNESLNGALIAVARLRGQLRGISSAAGMVAVVVVLGIGAVEVQRGYSTVGLVVAAMLVTRMLQAPIRSLGLAHDYWHRGQVSREKVAEYLRSSSRGLEREGSYALKVSRGEIEFRGVGVQDVLRPVDAVVPPRSVVVITGPGGCGKSTLLRLVGRLAEPTRGQVLIDGTDLATTSPRSTFRYVGMVSPDLPLMRGTIRRNITYSRPDASPAEVERVVALTGLDELLTRLPEGIETWVTEGGRNLSAAQRQLVALARALVGNPRVLLFDEPFAHLDAEAAAHMRRVVSRHQGTVLMVSHNPIDLESADLVWHLDGDGLQQMTAAEHVRLRRAALKGVNRWNHVAS
jgi:ABC-type multidrug transport system fused ATPase/permease subunit